MSNIATHPWNEDTLVLFHLDSHPVCKEKKPDWMKLTYFKFLKMKMKVWRAIQIKDDAFGTFLSSLNLLTWSLLFTSNNIKIRV